MNKMWRHIGALDDSVAIRYAEPFIEYNHKNTPVRLYRNVDATEKHLLELSPEDAKEIKKFCNNIRKVKNLGMPVDNLPGVKGVKKNRPPFSMLFTFLSALRMMNVYSKMSREQYVNRFSHEGLREMLLAMPGDGQGVAMLFMTMGALARGDGGFPEGGSLPFVARIESHFRSLGGELLCNTRVERVIFENNRATGVVANGKTLPADALIVATDTMVIDKLFDTPPKAAWLDEMRERTRPTTATFVSMGINADLRKYPERPLVKLPQPIVLGDHVYKSLLLANYADDSAYSPEGKTALTMQLPTDTYDFWKKAKEENRYAEEKQKLAEELITAIETLMPNAHGKIEVVDVATPLTYERYCGNWKGSWMTNITSDMKFKTYPSVIEGLSGVYFASHRLQPPGGLPCAMTSGRKAVQYLCRDTGTLFVSEE
jgi:phytoene dehydrogenase-like protein